MQINASLIVHNLIRVKEARIVNIVYFFNFATVDDIVECFFSAYRATNRSMIYLMGAPPLDYVGVSLIETQGRMSDWLAVVIASWGRRISLRNHL